MPNEKLVKDAEALREVAATARWFAGLARGAGEEEKVTSNIEDASVMERWASFCEERAND